MPVEPQIYPGAGNPAAQPLDLDLIRQEPVEGAEVTFTEDGGAEIDFDPTADDEQVEAEFGANLAEYMKEADLDELSGDLLSRYTADEQSRDEWKKTYIEGLDLLGLKFEDRNKPWNGACGVFHPLLTEAVVRFQAQTIQEIFPAAGPAKAKEEGKSTPEKTQQQHRVVNYLNYTTTTEMEEYRPETEQLLFCLPIAGSAFRKVYFDPELGRPAAMFVPAEDFCVSYGASDLSTCERATHIMKRTPNQIRKAQVDGFYRDVELPTPQPDIEDIREKYDKMTGASADYQFDDRHTLLEMVVDYDLKGFEDPSGVALPYVITLDKSSGEVLRIRRNWKESDPKHQRMTHFVHYRYLPGLGFYGFGLVHIIGGLSKSATSLLRQLVDSGTLNNLQAGFKTRGLRIKGDDSPLMPGEWRDVDVPGGKISDNLYAVPTKEPSNVLYQLLGDLVQEGRRFASAADVKAADMNAEAPVGTTLAILEREMKVMSAVQARIHHAMGKELVLLADVIKEHGPEQYPYEIEGEHSPRQDFDDRVDIIPVSDPNAGTMAQRIMQYQAALQLSATAPQIYDTPYLHRQMLEVLGIEGAGKIVPIEDDMKPMDPVSENMALIKGEPVKAFMYQDHEAHIQVHLAMAQNPHIAQVMEQHPNAQAIMQAGAAHVAEHVAYAYRRRMEQELGAELPGPDEPMTEDIELRLSRLAAPAAEQLTGKAQQQQQAEENAEKQEDPIIQLQEKELALKEQKEQREDRKAAEEAALKRDKMEQEDLHKVLDIAAQQESEKNRKGTEEFKAGAKAAEAALSALSRNKQGD
jgi:hypothetical protein